MESSDESFTDNDHAASSNFSSYVGDYFYDFVRSQVYPQTHEWVILAIYMLILLLALGGNTLVCYAVLRNEHMRTVTNYYIVNLSVADILVSLICLGPTASVDVTETWWYGEMGCKIIPYFQHVAECVSIYTLTAIAADRYLAICHPLKFRIRASRTIFIMIAIWIWSSIAVLPQAVFMRRQLEPTVRIINKPVWLSKCYEVGWHDTIWQKMYHIGIVLVTYILPLCVITVAYSMVCMRLWSAIPTEETRRKRPTETHSNRYGRNDVTGKSTSTGNGLTSEATVTKAGPIKTGTETQVESRRKVARMLIVVVIIFAICYLPLNVINIVRYLGFMSNGSNRYQSHRNKVHILFLFAHLLVYINSALNPIIYNFLSAKFRREFRMAFSSCACKQSAGRRPDVMGITSASTTASRRAQRPHTTGRATSTEYMQMSKVITRSNRPQSSSSDF